MARFDVVIPPGSEKTYERFHFAPATKVGNTIYCSGVIGGESACADSCAAVFSR